MGCVQQKNNKGSKINQPGISDKNPKTQSKQSIKNKEVQQTRQNTNALEWISFQQIKKLPQQEQIKYWHWYYTQFYPMMMNITRQHQQIEQQKHKRVYSEQVLPNLQNYDRLKQSLQDSHQKEKIIQKKPLLLNPQQMREMLQLPGKSNIVVNPQPQSDINIDIRTKQVQRIKQQELSKQQLL